MHSRKLYRLTVLILVWIFPTLCAAQLLPWKIVADSCVHGIVSDGQVLYGINPDGTIIMTSTDCGLHWTEFYRPTLYSGRESPMSEGCTEAINQLWVDNADVFYSLICGGQVFGTSPTISGIRSVRNGQVKGTHGNTSAYFIRGALMSYIVRSEQSLPAEYSIDSGQTWHASALSRPTQFCTLGTRVYALTQSSENLQYSDDSLKTSTTVHTFNSFTRYCLSQIISDNNKLISLAYQLTSPSVESDLYISTDTAQSWTPFGMPLDLINKVESFAIAKDTLIISLKHPKACLLSALQFNQTEPNIHCKQFGNMVEIQWSNEHQGSIHCTVLDIQGRACQSFELCNDSAPQSPLRINLENLSSGVYFIQLEDTHQSYRTSVIKY